MAYRNSPEDRPYDCGVRISRPSAVLAVTLFCVLVAAQLVYPQVPDRWTMPMTALTVMLFLGAPVAAAWHRSGPRYALCLPGHAFLVGLLVACIASVGAALADSLPVLVAARTLQGAGCAAGPA